MRAVLAMLFALACIAVPAAAAPYGDPPANTERDPPYDENWSEEYPGSWSVYGGQSQCEAEGRRVMDRLARIKADPGMMTRPDSYGSRSDAINYTNIWNKYRRWQGFRCVTIYRNLPNKHLNKNDTNTYIRAIFLQGHTPIKQTGRLKVGSRDTSYIPPNPVGLWDVRTNQGRHYALELSRNGSDISGTIKDDSGASGSVSGRIAGQMMQMDYSLPGRSGRATVAIKGDTFTGPDLTNGGAWTATRMPQDAEPFGPWTVQTSTGASYVLHLYRAGPNVSGTIKDISGVMGQIGGQIGGSTMVLRYDVMGRSGAVVANLNGDSFAGVEEAHIPHPGAMPIRGVGWQGKRQ